MRSAAGDDPESAGARTPASSVGEAYNGRLTRFRGRLLAAENTGPAQSVENSRRNRRRVEGFSVGKKRAAAGSERMLSAEEVALAARPLPPPEPPFPKSGQHADIVAWREDLIKLGDEDSSLLTLRAIRGSNDVKSAMSLDVRDMILDVACSVVNVSATDPEGNVVAYCTGIITEYDEAGKCAKILSSSWLMCSKEGKLGDPNQKVSVHLSNDTVVEASVLFFNHHYGVSFLDINTEFPLVPATLGSKPYYGQNVFVVDRDDEYALDFSHGSILYLERSYYERNHYMFASYNRSLLCVGGPVIDNNGEVIGLITSHIPQSAILSISIVKKCIQMWNKFGHIAHPIHHLELKTVRMLDMVYRDELRVCHSIKSGFIVHEVCRNSTVEKIGLRRGDVIDFIDLDQRSTVVELEEFLLTLGWDFLEKKLDSHSTIDVKIRVHDIRAKTSVCTILPMGFSDATVRSYR